MRIRLNIAGLIGLGLLLTFSCSKSSSPVEPSGPAGPGPETPNARISGSTPGTDVSDRPYNLNVVYFVPTDLDTLPDYQKRLDEMMIYGKDWYHERMKIYGYDKTFGLMTDAEKAHVRITTIYGVKSSAQYTTEGGASVMWKEIEAYFDAHPEEKSSDHYLNIVPRYSFKPNGEPTGPPYHGATFGKNRTCFVLDYEDMSMKNLEDQTDKGKWFRLYYGGLLHELGHALNLPHNMQTVTELNDPEKGTSMMHGGNYSFGVRPTFLTPSDCAMLAVNPVFNTVERVYYEPAVAQLTAVEAHYDAAKGAIVISGSFTTDVPVNGIAVYNDPNVDNEGIGVNRDYNALSFATKPGPGNTFQLEMPVVDFTFRSNEDYELKIFFIHENGTFSNAYYSYRFINNLPVLDFNTRPELSKDGWSVVAVSSEEASEGKAVGIIDGNTSTFWHSRWSSNPAVYPHFITIELQEAASAKGLVLWSRMGPSRPVKDFELLVSENGTDFVSLGDKTTIYSQGPQYFTFEKEQPVKAFKIVCKSSWDGTGNVAIAELGLY